MAKGTKIKRILPNESEADTVVSIFVQLYWQLCMCVCVCVCVWHVKKTVQKAPEVKALFNRQVQKSAEARVSINRQVQMFPEIRASISNRKVQRST
jgi:hypothetical protein